MDAFISYRRDGGLDLARNIHDKLFLQKYYSFFDLDSCKDGLFSETIHQSISDSKNVIVILSKNALDRCVELKEDDWVQKEIEEAFSQAINIIPIMCEGFSFPKDLPPSIDKIRFIQAIPYTGENFDEMLNTLIERLQNKDGEPLRLSKKKNISNTFYEENMSDEEKKRIRFDYEVCKSIEADIFDRLLEGKNNISIFNPAIYDVDTYMEKYNREEISKVYGLVNSQEEANYAMEKYGKGKLPGKEVWIQVGNAEHSNFEDEMDSLLSQSFEKSFDMVDLTLILRDLADAEEKLIQIVDRISPGGIVYIRELDHGMAMAYPDDGNKFEKLLEYIERDEYSGDYQAGRKVFYWMRNADLTDIHFEAKQISTVGLERPKKRILFDTLFSYLQCEYEAMYKKEQTTYAKEAISWLKENYSVLKKRFSEEDFFYSSGFVEFYGFVKQ